MHFRLGVPEHTREVNEPPVRTIIFVCCCAHVWRRTRTHIDRWRTRRATCMAAGRYYYAHRSFVVGEGSKGEIVSARGSDEGLFCSESAGRLLSSADGRPPGNAPMTTTVTSRHCDDAERHVRARAMTQRPWDARTAASRLCVRLAERTIKHGRRLSTVTSGWGCPGRNIGGTSS